MLRAHRQDQPDRALVQGIGAANSRSRSAVELLGAAPARHVELAAPAGSPVRRRSQREVAARHRARPGWRPGPGHRRRQCRRVQVTSAGLELDQAGLGGLSR